MRVIKPLRISVLQRVLTIKRVNHLSIGLLVYFPFEAPEVALAEIPMWKNVSEQLGKDAILDEVLPKTRSEFLVYGKAFSPGQQPRPAFSAKVQVGQVEKTLFVVGRRRWRLDGPTEPEPMTEMPVTWENAFGGAGFALNPAGMGFAPIEQDGAKVHLLPHLENPKHLIKSPTDRPSPASFGALDPTLEQRISKMGTYGKKWLETDFPGFARDLDPEYFQVAPEDQRFEGYFQGGEEIVIENMHLEKTRLTSTIPRLRARCYVTQKGADGEEPLQEVATRMETLLLLPNIERGVLIFRGVIPVVDDDAADVTMLMAALEDPAVPKPIEHYRKVLKQRVDRETSHLYGLRDRDLLPEPPPEAPALANEPIGDMEELTRRDGCLEERARTRMQRELDRARMEMRVLGMDPDEKLPKDVPPQGKPPKLDEMADFVEDAQKQAAEMQKMAEAQQKSAEAEARKTCADLGLDFDEIVEKGKRESGGPPKFRAEAELARMRELVETGHKLGVPLTDLEAKIEDPSFVARLRKTEEALLGAYRGFAHIFVPAQVPEAEAQAEVRAEVEKAVREKESLARRDLTGIDLSGMNLAKVDLREALLECANLSGADLSGADLSGAVLARAKLSETCLEGAILAGTNLGEAHAQGTNFAKCDLRKAVFHKTHLEGARFGEADLRGADFFEAKVIGADFSGANAPEVIFFQLQLGDARFTDAILTKAIFFQCKGGKLDFDRATLEGAGFLELEADSPTFRDAKAANLRLISTSAIPGADFTGATLTTSLFRGVNLTGAKFDGASADSTDFSEATLRGASLKAMSAKAGMFIRTDLTDADLTEANLMECLLQKANVAGTRFERANLFRANLLQAKGDDRTSFSDAHIKRVLFTRKDG